MGRPAVHRPDGALPRGRRPWAGPSVASTGSATSERAPCRSSCPDRQIALMRSIKAAFDRKVSSTPVRYSTLHEKRRPHHPGLLTQQALRAGLPFERGAAEETRTFTNVPTRDGVSLSKRTGIRPSVLPEGIPSFDRGLQRGRGRSFRLRAACARRPSWQAPRSTPSTCWAFSSCGTSSAQCALAAPGRGEYMATYAML